MDLIRISKAQLAYGTHPLLDNADAVIETGERVCVVGRNGAGKSTLLKVLDGQVILDDGEINQLGSIKISRLEQDPPKGASGSVFDYVAQGMPEIANLLIDFHHVSTELQTDCTDKLLNKLERLSNQLEAADGWRFDSRIQLVLTQLELAPEAKLESLSGGWLRKVALARALVSEPDLLLLDEPTNHLDAESVEWLEQHLKQYKGTVIAVTHDRYFLDNVAGWILELDRGQGIPWKGNYTGWLEQKSKRLEMEEKTASKRRKTLERELEWVRMAPKARHAKSKARLNNYEKLLSEEGAEKLEKLEIFIPSGPRLGSKVIEAKNLSKAFGEKLLFANLDFSLPPGGIVGVIGPNGAGKTTLFRLIMGLENPDEGTFDLGDTVKVGYVDQEHQEINPNKSVWEIISGGHDNIQLGNRSMNSRAYVSRFNFSGPDQEKKSEILSGGERNRMHLALTLRQEANVLLLDEPTNDIDVNTLRALEEGLENFAGCAVVISHDRWFLDRIATHILAFEGNSNVYFFEGSYSDYEENKKKRLGDNEPKRIRYRKLM